jgi:hypothetical protein
MILILGRGNITTRIEVANDAKEEVMFFVIAAIMDKDGCKLVVLIKVKFPLDFIYQFLTSCYRFPFHKWKKA